MDTKDTMDADEGRAAERTVVVAVVNSTAAAEIIAGLLENHGISALIRGDDAGAQFPSLEPLRGVKVLVLESEAEIARAALASAEPLDEDEAPPQE